MPAVYTKVKGAWSKAKKLKFNPVFCFNLNNALPRYFKCVTKFSMSAFGIEARNDAKNLFKKLM